MTIVVPTHNELMHYGVKGMKWGVRKKENTSDADIRQKLTNDDTYKDRYKSLRNYEGFDKVLTTKNGTKVRVTEDKKTVVAAAIQALGKKSAKTSLNSKMFTLAVDGKQVGEASVDLKENGELYLNWLGVNPKERGKGYGSAAFDSAVAFGKEVGASKLTLEVPGKSPDARHIYKKRGFVVSGKTEGSKDDLWGGLTPMSLDLTKNNLKHSNIDDVSEEILMKTFDILDEESMRIIYSVFDSIEHSSLTHKGMVFLMSELLFTPIHQDDNELEHYGVKGMKRGVRRRVAKNKKLVDKYQQKTEDVLRKHKNAIDKANANKREIQKNKENSGLYRAMKEKASVDAYNQTYSTTRSPLAATLAGKTVSDHYTPDVAISDLDKNITLYKKSAKEWMQVKEGLMNVDVESVKPKQIKKFYRDPNNKPLS